MARPLTQLTLSAEDRELLEKHFRETPDVRTRARLGALRMLCGGTHTLAEVAEAVGCARSTLQVWVELYRQGGLATVTSREKPGASSSPMQDAVLQQQLRENLASGTFRTGPQMRRWLEEKHGIALSVQAVYYWLKSFGAKLRVPRPVHIKKNPQAPAAFVAGLEDTLAALPLPPGRPVRLWVEDEARFGLHTLVRRCWALPGVRVVLPQQRKFQWAYMFSALEISTGRHFPLWMPGVDLGITTTYLEQLAASEPDAEHIIIWDGAGFHPRTGLHPLPGNVHLLRLPPYSPELNPVEKLWDIIKDGICNRIFPTLDDLYDALVIEMEPFQQPERVFQLLGNSDMLASANVSSNQ